MKIYQIIIVILLIVSISVTACNFGGPNVEATTISIEATNKSIDATREAEAIQYTREAEARNEVVEVVTATPTVTPLGPTSTATPIPTPAPSNTPTPDPRLFWDDFDRGIKPDWQIIQGYCSMSDGHLSCPDDSSRIEVGNYNWVNYVVEFETSGYWHPGWSEFLMKISDDGTYLKMRLPVCKDISWIYHGPNGEEQEIAKGNGGVCEKGPFRIQVESKDGIYITKINGNAVSTFQENRTPNGRIGFIIKGPWFDNVSVSGIN